MLFVVFPLTCVLGAICMYVSPYAVALIVNPLTLIFVSIRMDQLSVPVDVIISEFSVIHCSVLPNLSPSTISQAI